jgi:iron complex outermembrane receptor protein
MIKQIYLIVLSMLISQILLANSIKTSLAGKIIDKEKNTPIANATIYFPDLKTGTTSAIDGSFKIDNLPKTKILIQISSVGFQNIIETIDLSISKEINFELEPAIKEINEVIITGLSNSSERNRTPVTISTVSHLTLLQNSSTNIIDALAKQPGISQITTGSGISKPVIRGLGFNRVVVVNDGIKQEGQQWGDEHGIEIDEFSVNKVELLKGPASLSYGSDAMAGVINMISFPTLQQGLIKGNLLTNYQTNNGLIGCSANVSGNTNNIIWDVRLSEKNAHAYQNKKDGYVLNSGYTERNFSSIVGINKHWGYSHLHISAYELIPGIVEGERDSTTGKFVKEIKINDSTSQKSIATNRDFKSYTAMVPFQKVMHYKAVLNNNFYIQGKSLKLTFGLQQNRRQEFANVLQPSNYGLFFLMNTFSYDAKYNVYENEKSSISIGLNGMFQNSKNKGSEFLIPEYSLFDIGSYIIAKKQLGKFDIGGGLRFDSRNENTTALWLDKNEKISSASNPNSIQKFQSASNKFSGYSGSLGVAYKISKNYYTKLNFSKGFRAPNIAELASNGVHEGTLRYELGDANLKAESSLQTDYTLGINSKHISAELNLFDNYIHNFIFLRKLNSAFGGDSILSRVPSFKFQQGDANLCGGEISVDIHPHPLDWLHIENSFSYVRAKQLKQSDSTSNLPFIPAPRFQSEIKIEKQKFTKHIRNAYFKIGFEYNFAQNKIFKAYQTETKTNSYSLINTGFGADIQRKNETLLSIYFNVNNITDVAYQSHLSRLKYAPINYSTSNIGIYNMGRNISLKIIFPITFKKIK